MFYLKYRPKTIREIDNSRVKEIISKILKSASIPHAFLFIGQKGTGKTSLARIVAKSVNCLNNHSSKNQSIEPCNICKNCLSINASSSADVIELDAASNRGIDDIRSLIRESNFFPMTCRYRVFIIDEAHMITADAFNALLKTLEEPPPSVIFILATTNQEKIPKTIASRCCLINFGKAKKIDIISMLKRIVIQEKINIDDKLFPLIASHSDYSFRDATKMLEELVTQQKLTLEQGREFLGILKQGFFKVLQSGDIKQSLNWIELFSESGGNIKNLIEQLLDELHLTMLIKSGVKLDEEDIPDFSLSEIVILMKLLMEAYNTLRISPIDSLPLEIAVVEFYNKGKEIKKMRN